MYGFAILVNRPIFQGQFKKNLGPNFKGSGDKEVAKKLLKKCRKMYKIKN